MEPNKHPNILLTATCEGKRIRGRPCRTTRDSFVDGLKLLTNCIGERGHFKDWCGFARVKKKWSKMVKGRIQVEKGDVEETND